LQTSIPAIPSFLLGVLLVAFCAVLLLAVGFVLERVTYARASLAAFGLGCIVASVGVMLAVLAVLGRR
jgi:hypothetical protein